MIGSWNIHTQIDTDKVAHIQQVHGNTIITPDDIQPADGILVALEDPLIGIRTADCLPLVLTTSTHALILHVSRKTLTKGLLERAPDFLDIRAVTTIYIGPHICENHFTFEWEGEEITEFKKKFPDAVTEREGVLHLSLKKAVQQYIAEWGVDSEIKEDRRCTFENITLPSYKRWLDGDKQAKLTHLVTTVV